MNKRKHITIGCIILILTLMMSTVSVSAASEKLNYKRITVCTNQTKVLKVLNTKKTVKWKTGNKKIATVNNKGRVTGKKAGTVTVTAKVNGKTLKCKVTVKAHNYKITATKKATCTTNGYQTKKCKKCGYKYKNVLKKLGHDFVSDYTIDTEPTCTDDGSKSRHCSRCDAVTDETTIAKTGVHIYGDWIVTKEAIGTTLGNRMKVCKICQDTIYEIVVPDLGEKLYDFGALSDVHVSDSVETSEEDFRRALRFFQNEEQVDFVCIAGDLTQYSYEEEWQLYMQCVEEESENTPVYPIGGNHDAYGLGMTDVLFEKYTGHGTFYTFEYDGDIFIMMTQLAWASQNEGIQPYGAFQLQMLYETLEANRNKRCFIFQHIFPWGGAGDPFELYGSNSFWGTQGNVIYSLMEHYPNALWFHGHSHQMFETQRYHDGATYDYNYGCHNIHIPSCAEPVYVDGVTRKDNIQGSQGYVVEVYEDAVLLRGRDFVKEEFLSIGTFCLDTTIKPVEAGTYIDSTGTIID